jgi:hypothetical protein
VVGTRGIRMDLSIRMDLTGAIWRHKSDGEGVGENMNGILKGTVMVPYNTLTY